MKNKSIVIIAAMIFAVFSSVQADSKNNWETLDDSILNILLANEISGNLSWREGEEAQLKDKSYLTYGDTKYDTLFSYEDIDLYDILYLTDGSDRYDSILKITLKETESKHGSDESHVLDSVFLDTYSWTKKCKKYRDNGTCKEYKDKYRKTLTDSNEIYTMSTQTQDTQTQQNLPIEPVTVDEPNLFFLLSIGAINLFFIKRFLITHKADKLVLA